MLNLPLNVHENDNNVLEPNMKDLNVASSELVA